MEGLQARERGVKKRQALILFLAASLLSHAQSIQGGRERGGEGVVNPCRINCWLLQVERSEVSKDKGGWGELRVRGQVGGWEAMWVVGALHRGQVAGGKLDGWWVSGRRIAGGQEGGKP